LANFFELSKKIATFAEKSVSEVRELD